MKQREGTREVEKHTGQEVEERESQIKSKQSSTPEQSPS